MRGFRNFPSELYGGARDLYFQRQFQYLSQFSISLMGFMMIQSLWHIIWSKASYLKLWSKTHCPMLFQKKSFTSLSSLTAVEAVLWHVRIIGLATSLQVLVEVLLYAQVIIVVCLPLRHPVPQIQCWHRPDQPGPTFSCSCRRRGAGGQVGIFIV